MPEADICDRARSMQRRAISLQPWVATLKIPLDSISYPHPPAASDPVPDNHTASRCSLVIMESEIVAQIPSIDPLISKYACGYLEHALNLPDPNGHGATDLVDSLTALLVSASGDLTAENEIKIHALVNKLVDRLNTANGTDGAKRQLAPSAKRLDQTIHVGSQRNISSTLALASGNVDLEAAAGRKVESRVDRKKLEKAEAKIRAKQERKVMKNVEYEASRLLNVPDETQSYEDFYMSVNPLQLGADAATKSKDIKVDGIDISIGGKRILTDTNLTLRYGGRYGLVGQNGIGRLPAHPAQTCRYLRLILMSCPIK